MPACLSIRICLALLPVLLYATLQAAPWTLGKGMEAWGGVGIATQGPRMFTATTDGIFRSDDRGTTWRKSGSGIPDSDYTIKLQAAGGILFAGTVHDAVFRSADSGETWKKITLPVQATESYFEAVLEKGSTLYAGVGKGVLTSKDGGLTWVFTGIGTSFYTYFSSLATVGDAVFAGTSIKGVFLLSQADGTWNPFPDTLKTGAWIRDLAGSGGNLFAASDKCGVCRTADSGKTWTQVLAPNRFGRTFRPQRLIAAGNSLYLGTDSLGVLRSDDAGGTWVQSGTGLPRGAWVQDAGAAEGGVYALTQRGLFRSSDGGKSWKKSQEGLPSVTSPLSLQPLGSLTFAVMRYSTSSEAGYLFRSSDTGRTWEEIGDSVPGTGRIWGLYRVGNDLVADVDTLGLFRSRDLGVTWRFTGTGLPKGKGQIISEVAEKDGFVFAAPRSGLYRSKDSGSTWEPANTGFPANVDVQSLLVAGPDLYVGSWLDGLYRSSDNGTSWSLIPSDLGARSIYALAAVGSTLYAGTGNAGAFRSVSNGESWSRFNASAPFTDILAFAVDGNRLFAGAFQAGVQMSVQGGPWIPIGTELPGTFIDRFAVQGGYLIAGVEGKGVWRMALSDPSLAAIERGRNGIGAVPGVYSRFLPGGRLGFGRTGASETAVDAVGRSIPRLP
jgi:photosystem II stability/assembly factor-like uncharacterized protein